MYLEDLRKEIDVIDKELLKLYERRMEIVKNVAIYKEENNLPITNASREKDVISKVCSNLENKNIQEESIELFKKIISLSKVYEHKLINNDLNCEFEKTNFRKDTEKLVYQGAPGSYSHEAMANFFGEDISSYNVKTFDNVFFEIKSGKADYGILPIENSSTGVINEVYDLLLKFNFYICYEIMLKIDHNLMSVNGGALEKIEEVFSHEQGFFQSSEFLKKYPKLKLTNYFNTALSAEYVKQLNDPTKAAIASKNAAKIYNLNILKENINFNSNNYTRFIVISDKMKASDDSNKISIVLSFPSKSGSLFNILSYFSKNNLNMVKIESRPDLTKTFEYLFYIDFQGNLNDDLVKNVLNDIKNHSSYFKILGNYKGATFNEL